jgi:WhiB family transcriptional regulator, redox-sensing transcriptional regulator
MSDLASFIESTPNMLWLDHAGCADMDISDFFVEAGHTIDQQVLNVCRSCPVRRDCLDHSYRRQITGGYFAGISPGQRRQMTHAEAVNFIEHDPVRPPRVVRRTR